MNTAANLEILAQLVPFMISWPNPDVQQMMLGSRWLVRQGGPLVPGGLYCFIDQKTVSNALDLYVDLDLGGFELF